jgi:hypothetical protein
MQWLKTIRFPGSVGNGMAGSFDWGPPSLRERPIRAGHGCHASLGKQSVREFLVVAPGGQAPSSRLGESTHPAAARI